MASALLLLRGPVGRFRVQDSCSCSNFVGLQTLLDGHMGGRGRGHLHQPGWWVAQDRWSRGPQGPPGSPPPPWLRWPTVALDRRAGFEAAEEKVPHAPTSHPLNPPDTPTSREWNHPSGPRHIACHKPTWCDIITTFRPPLKSDYKMEPKSEVRGTAGSLTHDLWWPLTTEEHKETRAWLKWPPKSYGLRLSQALKCSLPYGTMFIFGKWTRLAQSYQYWGNLKIMLTILTDLGWKPSVETVLWCILTFSGL